MLTAAGEKGPSQASRYARLGASPATRTGAPRLWVDSSTWTCASSASSGRRRRPRGEHGRVRSPGRATRPRAAGAGSAGRGRPRAPGRSRSSSVASVRSHSMPKAPNSAVAARKSRRSVRPWCARWGQTWAPRYSGATNRVVQRWICCRASASVVSEVHTRCTRSRTPRSIRPPPEAHDSQSTPGGRRGAGRAAGRRRGSAGAPPAPRGSAGVPPPAGRGCGPTSPRRWGRRRAPRDLRRRGTRDLGPGQVEHVLVPVGSGNRSPAGEDPVGVGAEEVGVGVDHLGLEPEPELHAQAADVVDQRGEALGPDRLVDPPVAEAGACRRGGWRNQPSSSTKRSTPTRAARSAIAAAGRGRGRSRPPPRR